MMEQRKNFRPGDRALNALRHDAWVVGNESAVAINFMGLKRLCKKRKNK